MISTASVLSACRQLFRSGRFALVLFSLGLAATMVGGLQAADREDAATTPTLSPADSHPSTVSAPPLDDDAPDELRQAIEQAKAGEHEKALPLFAKALAAAPENAAVQFYAGLNFATLNMREKAEERWREAVRLAPGEPAYGAALGQLLSQKGAHEEAIAALRKVLELEPGNPVHHFNLAQALMAAERRSEAIEHFRVASEKRPKDARACHNYGAALLAEERYNEAEPVLRRATQMDPKNGNSHFLLGMLFAKTRRFQAASHEWSEALRLLPGEVLVYGPLAWLYATAEDPDLQNPEAALLLARRANELTNYARPEMLNLLAVALSVNERYREAAEAMQKGIDAARRYGMQKLAAEYEPRLRLFESGKAYEPRHGDNVFY